MSALNRRRKTSQGKFLDCDATYIVELSADTDPATAFRALSDRPHCVFLDSARRGSARSRYSFLAVDPFELIAGNELSSLDRLETALTQFATPPDLAELTPLPGGAIGFFSYDLSRQLESLPQPRFDEFRLPLIHIGLYDVVLTFDHELNCSFLVSQGFPELEPTARAARAKQRAEQVLSWLDASPNPPPAVPQQKRTAPSCDEAKLLAPQFPTPHQDVFSTFTAEEYRDTIAQGIEYIHAGDVFQVNLAQRLMCQASEPSVSLYLKLREQNAAPFAAYLDTGEHQIISASPERFLQVRDRVVETRPIKGTRPRHALPEADLFTGAELSASGKDLSENVMIVDLMRNDLSRVCDDDSITVQQLCDLETYEHVQHLVSVVTGKLREGISNVDLLRCTFPGGSVTGAPKIRAMEIIAELEPTARGAYCGSLGYFGFGGDMDLNILIRTITAGGGWWQFPVGGGIVAQSEPQAELEETWSKAAGILHAVRESTT